MTPKRKQLPPGSLLMCPGCRSAWLYAYQADGRLLVVCTSCKYWVEGPAAPPEKAKGPPAVTKEKEE